jgi:hypothetical protein
MRMLAIAPGLTAALLVAGSLSRKADATTLSSGTVNLPSAAKNYSPVEKAGCYRVGRYGLGWHRGLRPDLVLVRALLA